MDTHTQMDPLGIDRANYSPLNGWKKRQEERKTNGYLIEDIVNWDGEWRKEIRFMMINSFLIYL